MGKLWDKITRKAFFLEFNTLNTPTAQEVCDAILDYAKKSGSKVTFVATKMPVQFYFDEVLYTTKRGTSRGGPVVRCVEVKNGDTD